MEDNLKVTKDDVLAVDADIIAYRTAAVCEDHFEGSAYAIIKTTLNDIVNDTQIPNLRLYLSGENNFRYDVAKTKPYKGNRATMVRPRFLPAVREHLIEQYNALVVDGFEADDAIATDMTVNNAIHCGIDKDILQIPGRHYNYVKKEWQYVNEEQAIITLYRQVIMGDNSDNIPGLPRWGEAKAAKAITNAETALEDAMAVYEQVVKDVMVDVNPIEYMAEQLKLVQMRTDIPLIFLKSTDMTVKNMVIPLDTDGFESHEPIEEQPVKDVETKTALKL